MTNIEEKKPEVSEDELTKVFNELDDDGNGFITPREAKKAYKKLADKFNIPRVRKSFKMTFVSLSNPTLTVFFRTKSMIGLQQQTSTLMGRLHWKSSNWEWLEIL